jgi:hypothetical protein
MQVAVDVVGPVASKVESDPLAHVSGLEELSVKATVPVGDPRPDVPVTVAVRVTAVWYLAGLAEEVTTVAVVGSTTTVSLMPEAQAEAAALLLASPAEEAYHQ